MNPTAAFRVAQADGAVGAAGDGRWWWPAVTGEADGCQQTHQEDEDCCGKNDPSSFTHCSQVLHSLAAEKQAGMIVYSFWVTRSSLRLFGQVGARQFALSAVGALAWARVGHTYRIWDNMANGQKGGAVGKHQGFGN